MKTRAKCEELKLVPPDTEIRGRCNEFVYIAWYTSSKEIHCIPTPDESIPGLTTWITSNNWTCGPRCMGLYAWQIEDTGLDDSTDVPHTKPRLWFCNNTFGEVEATDSGNYDNSSDPALSITADAALSLAGAIARSGIAESGDDFEESNRVLGNFNYDFNPGDNATNSSIADLVMRFTVGALSALDNSPIYPYRTNVDGLEPSIAQVVNVEWWRAGPILVGIPAVQLLMLVGVVLFSGKAIILEPSYFTVAHLLYPVMQKLGRRGILMTVDEMSEMLGPDFKIAYAVRPDPNEAGQWNKEAVRDLDLVEESEGFGYIRGRMPEGRYD